MTDRFDLEQDIMNCWNVVEDIKTIYDRIDYTDQDQVMNSLLGLQTLYQMKFEKMWETFEKLIVDKKL